MEMYLRRNTDCLPGPCVWQRSCCWNEVLLFVERVTAQFLISVSSLNTFQGTKRTFHSGSSVQLLVDPSLLNLHSLVKALSSAFITQIGKHISLMTLRESDQKMQATIQLCPSGTERIMPRPITPGNSKPNYFVQGVPEKDWVSCMFPVWTISTTAGFK